MKQRTWELVAKHMKEDKMYFPEDSPFCRIWLTNGEIRAIIQSEYGINSKKFRIMKKNLSKVINEMLLIIVEDLR